MLYAKQFFVFGLMHGLSKMNANESLSNRLKIDQSHFDCKYLPAFMKNAFLYGDGPDCRHPEKASQKGDLNID